MNDLWTLPQALAWCIWRNEEKVQKTKELGIDCMGLLNAAIREADGDQGKGEYAFSIRNDFHETLFSGKLKAVGLPKGELTTREIPPAGWRDIDEFRIFFHGKSPEDVGLINRNGDQEVIYSRVTVNRNDVQKQWPPLRTYKKPEKKSALAAVRRFLEKKMADGVKITQDGAYLMTREEFPNVGRLSIREIVKLLTGNPKPGRPKAPK